MLTIISNRFTALVVATVATASDILQRSSSYDVHNWLNLNRRSTNSPVTDCGDDMMTIFLGMPICWRAFQKQ